MFVASGGVAWRGVAWSGVEWSGVQWSGVEWSGIETCIVLCCLLTEIRTRCLHQTSGRRAEETHRRELDEALAATCFWDVHAHTASCDAQRQEPLRASDCGVLN